MTTSTLPVRLGATLAALLCGVCFVCAASAQKTYRCGNTYQSHPCAGPTGGAATKGATVAAKPGAPATVSAAVAAPAAAPAPPAMSEAEQKAAAAAAQKKAKCDRITNDLNYNSAQQKSGGSKTTMDRLAGERKQIEADMKKEVCSA